MKSLHLPAPYAAVSVTLFPSATKILKQGPSHTSSPQLLDSIQTRVAVLAMAELGNTNTA